MSLDYTGLFTAIYNWYASEGVDSLAPLYLREAPQHTAAPYVVYMPVTSTIALTMASQDDLLTIQFSVFSDDDNDAEINAIGMALTAAFDNIDEELPLVNGSSVSVTRTSYNLLDDPDGQWHLQIDYQFRIEED